MDRGFADDRGGAQPVIMVDLPKLPGMEYPLRTANDG